MRTTGRLLAILVALAVAGCQASPQSSIVPSQTAGDASPTAGVDAATPSPSAGPAATAEPPAETAFEAPADRSRKGHLRVSSVLTSNDQPLAGTPVTVTITALDDTYQVITVKGIVPVETTGTLVGFRFNEELAGPARIAINVYSITYADGGSARNQATNSEFASGLYAWDVWGNGRATVEYSDRGDGRMLRLRARPDQHIGMNSSVQRFTAGSNFKLVVKALVPPAGQPSGYAAAFFVWGKNDTEGYRVTVPLVAPPIPPVDLMTAEDGAISLDLALPAGRYDVTMNYAGDAGHLAASVEQVVRVP